MISAANSANKTKRDAKSASKITTGGVYEYEESKDTVVIDAVVDVAHAKQGKFFINIFLTLYL